MAAPPPQQQGGSPQNDPTFSLIWILAALFAAIYIIWYNFHAQISYFYLKAQLYEALAVNFFTHDLASIVTWLQNLTLAQAERLKFNELFTVSAVIGLYLRWVMLVIGVAGMIFAYSHSPKLKFRKTYTMQSLIDCEEINWPQILPVAKLDLVKTPLDKGPWASAMTPLQFVKKYKIFKEEPAESTNQSLSRSNRFYISLLQEPAQRILSLQLGKLWTDVNALPIYMQALFAAFAAKANKDGKAASELLSQISRSSSEGKLNFTGTKELLSKYLNTSEVQKVYSGHAYVFTVLASMLELARSDGVLSTADFLWLKPVDRQLWYMLNVVGRQTPFVEVAGVFAHWLTEKQFGRPLIVPMVSEAVIALNEALKEILYIPDSTEQV